jgi:adenylate kinase family enzyme
MRRVCVVGTSGTGKSTFSSRLARILGAPHVELDMLSWEPDWVEASDEVFRSRVRAAVAGESWVVDGNYSRVRDEFWDRADTIVWLNYAFPVVLGRSARRTVRRIVRRETCCNGNTESLRRALSRDSIVLWVLRTYARRRRQYGALSQELLAQGRNVVVLRTPREAERWLASAQGNPRTPPGRVRRIHPKPDSGR